MTDIELLLLLLAAILGAIISAVLGWAESNESFNARKFLPSIVRAGISAAVIFVGTSYINIGTVTSLIYFLVFLSGMGIDAGGNRLAGAVLTKETKK